MVGGRTSVLRPRLRRVRFMTDLPLSNSTSECNASPASTPRNLLRSFKSVQETLEGERREASAAPEQFGTEWDVDIDDIDLQMVSAKPWRSGRWEPCATFIQTRGLMCSTKAERRQERDLVQEHGPRGFPVRKDALFDVEAFLR